MALHPPRAIPVRSLRLLIDPTPSMPTTSPPVTRPPARPDRIPSPRPTRPVPDMAQLLQHQSTNRARHPFGARSPSLRRPRRYGAARTPATLDRRHDIGAGFIVLVADVADDLLDRPRSSPCLRCRRLVDDQAVCSRWRAAVSSPHRRPGRRHRGDRQTMPASPVVARAPHGTSKTCLTWTMPIVSSRSPSIIRTREYPY